MNGQTEYLVFLVDDDKMFRTLLKNSLHEQFGASLKALEYSTAEECIQNINKSPHIIILDYYLNEENSNTMNGLQVLRKIKAASKDIIVIMLSGQDDLHIAIDCLKSGAYEYIAKSESTFVRIPNSIKNAIQNIKKEKKENDQYFKIHVRKSLLVGIIILIDIIWFCTSYMN